MVLWVFGRDNMYRSRLLPRQPATNHMTVRLLSLANIRGMHGDLIGRQPRGVSDYTAMRSSWAVGKSVPQYAAYFRLRLESAETGGTSLRPISADIPHWDAAAAQIDQALSGA